jgi:hypothetical protein
VESRRGKTDPALNFHINMTEQNKTFQISKSDSPWGGHSACLGATPYIRDASTTFHVPLASIFALLAVFGLFFPLRAHANPVPRHDAIAATVGANLSDDKAIQGKETKEFPALIYGVWRGDVVQKIVDQQEISLVAEFSEDKSCSIQIFMDSIMTGFGVTRANDSVHLRGSWEISDGMILATLRVEEWTQKIQHSDAPGHTGPVEETRKKLSGNELFFSFAYDSAKELITYYPTMGQFPPEKTKVTSADDKTLFLIAPIEMEKIENPLPDGNH